MYEAWKKLVFVAALCLCVLAAGAVLAQQPTYYFARTSYYNYQWIDVYAIAFDSSGDSDIGACDDYCIYGAFPDLTFDEDGTGSTSVASAYGRVFVHSYLNDDCQAVNAAMVETNPDVSCSLATGGGGCDFDACQEGLVSNSATLCGPDGTSTTVRITLDANWVGTDTYPDYGGVDHYFFRDLWGSATIGNTWINFYTDYDDTGFFTLIYVEGETPQGPYFKVCNTPLNSLVGSFQIGPDEVVDTVPVGQTVDISLDANDALWAEVFVESPYSPRGGFSADFTTKYDATLSLTADQ